MSLDKAEGKAIAAPSEGSHFNVRDLLGAPMQILKQMGDSGLGSLPGMALAGESAMKTGFLTQGGPPPELASFKPMTQALEAVKANMPSA